MAGLSRLALIAAGGLFLAACSASQAPDPQESREFFSQSEFGKASPRVVRRDQAVPKGGGRYHIGRPYRVAGRTYVPQDNPSYSATGQASWYGAAFHGRQTANGEVYDMHGLTAAHPTLPLPSYVRVTNRDNGRSIVLRVNDRGPFKRGRIIDVSRAAAIKLDFKEAGTANVRVDYVGRATLEGDDHRVLLASYTEPGRGPARVFGTRSRRTVAVANANAVLQSPTPRLRSTFENDATFRGAVAAGPPQVLTPAYTSVAGRDDLLAPLILSGGYVSSFAPLPPATPAHRAVADLAR